MRLRTIVSAVVLIGLSGCGSTGTSDTAPEETRSAAEPVVTGLRVAIYAGTGVASEKILPLFRAVQALGHEPRALDHNMIANGLLTTANYDVFIVPAGQDGQPCCANHYTDLGEGLGGGTMQGFMNAFVSSGGGLVAIEAGAAYASNNGGTWDIYGGNYTTVTTNAGIRNITIVDSAFGSGTQAVYESNGGGYFATPLSTGATAIANDSSGRPMAIRFNYGSGRVVLSAYDFEIRADSTLDWAIWDNWDCNGTHANSVGAWQMLGRMIGWAHNGDASAPTVQSIPNAGGYPVAVVSTHTNDGGAWGGLMPGIGRSIDNAGHVPLSIRFQDINSGKLTFPAFQVVVFPGGYSYGYKTGLAGHEANVRNFVSAGGGFYGICAGGFYAADTVVWEKKSYAYPLGLLHSADTGPINDIVGYPAWALTPVATNDPVLGTFTLQTLYYGGGYFTVPSDAQQGSHVTVAGTYDYSGAQHGSADYVRFLYGSGHVLLTGTHPESQSGSSNDWMDWDNYVYNTTTPLVNPDNTWQFVTAAFNNWLTL